MPEELPRVAGVRFRNAGRIFYFHTAGMRLDPGEFVVVETVRGPEVAKVVIAPDQVVVNELGREELKPILRLATESDIRKADQLRQQAEELLPEARRLGEELRFPAHIDGAEFTLDGRRLTFAFTSDERLDYRDFVKRAGDRFRTRVDMRQMGARDRAKMAGGYGICGRELCCASWLTTFPSISIRMAKEQELPLNPQKISGLCGRLLCCLSYEEEGYKEMRKTLPKIGQRCSTPPARARSSASTSSGVRSRCSPMVSASMFPTGISAPWYVGIRRARAATLRRASRGWTPSPRGSSRRPRKTGWRQTAPPPSLTGSMPGRPSSPARAAAASPEAGPARMSRRAHPAGNSSRSARKGASRIAARRAGRNAQPNPGPPGNHSNNVNSSLGANARSAGPRDNSRRRRTSAKGAYSSAPAARRARGQPSARPANHARRAGPSHPRTRLRPYRPMEASGRDGGETGAVAVAARAANSPLPDRSLCPA
ncbi:MAG: hypothetical protein IPI85_09570 [Dehalococcoidia bacterium]|nr:hypothetical protein [Dehalococcoidia bacterium]